MNCNEAVAAFIAALENGTPMTDEQRAHIRICGRCRELLDSAKQFQTLLGGNGIQTPPVEPALTIAEEEVRRRRTWRVLKITGIAVLSFAMGMAALHVRVHLPPAAVYAAAGTVAVSIAAWGIAFLMWIVRGTAGGTPRLYQRLGPGRMISGVCLGLADATGVDVRLIRIVFAALLFADGVGFWLYILLALAMPVHPDDRQYLLRFRLKRWWSRRTVDAR